MSRKKQAEPRKVEPDPLYESKLIAKLINKVMLDGKKSIAEKIVYEAFAYIKEKEKKNPIEVFEVALENIMPVLELKSRRIGGSNYQIPVEVRPRRKVILGLKWLVTYSRLRSDNGMSLKLANEIIDATNKTGGAFKKKQDIHKMADANKAFAHYRW